MKSREEALELLNSWVGSESLRGHCRAVAAAMDGYAKKYLEDGKLSAVEKVAGMSELSAVRAAVGMDIVDKWYLCGLLHDFDWERFPSLEEHPREGCKFLEENGYDEDIIEAILGHNAATGIPRRSLMARTLFAVDELSGLVVALSKVRPGGFDGMSAKSVRKVMKKKDFAAAISRADIRKGIEELGVDEGEHFELVISALGNVTF